MSSEPVSPLRDYLSAFRRQAWVILLAVVLAAFLAAMLVRTQEDIYQASTSMVVGVQGTTVTPPELGGPLLTQTVRSLVTSDVVARQVIDNLQLPITTAEFDKNLHVSILPQSSVVELSYDSTDREEALRVVQELSSIFNEVVTDRLKVEILPDAAATTTTFPGEEPVTQVPQLAPLVFVRVFDPPHAGTDPIAPQPAKTIAFAAAMGLAIGALLAVVREKLNGRVRTVRDAEQWFGLPVAAVLPKNSVQHPSHLLSSHATVPESLRFLGASILSVYAPKPGSLLVVSSATREERRSEVAASIAIALARSGQDVVCVDADVEPAVARHLGIADQILHAGSQDPRATAGHRFTLGDIGSPFPPLVEVPFGPGLPMGQSAHVLKPIPDTRTIHEAGYGDRAVDRRGRLRLLTPLVTGRVPYGFDETALREQVDALRASVDYVVVNGAPLPTGHTFRLVSDADHVIVVARTRTTTRDGATEMHELLGRLGAHDASVVLVDRRGERTR